MGLNKEGVTGKVHARTPMSHKLAVFTLQNQSQHRLRVTLSRLSGS